MRTNDLRTFWVKISETRENFDVSASKLSSISNGNGASNFNDPHLSRDLLNDGRA
jgi:hypothetical protein